MSSKKLAILWCRASGRSSLKLALACAAILAMLTLGGATAQAQVTILVNNLQPTWGVPGDGGGGVFSAYVGPPAYGYVSPGSTTIYDGRAAGIIKAGQGADLGPDFWDQGLFGFKPTVTINSFAAGPLTYDVENQAGVNPVWMTIEIDTGVVGDRDDNTVYQFVPTPNPAGWNTFDAGAGLWQKWNDGAGDTTGNPLISLGQVALDNTGLNVVRTYLRLGMGSSYYNGGTGTTAWVDKVTIGEVTYDFVVDKDQCKDRGWKLLTNGAGQPFKNQGDCIQYVRRNW